MDVTIQHGVDIVLDKERFQVFSRGIDLRVIMVESKSVVKGNVDSQKDPGGTFAVHR
jgi:hypothetical protein